MGMGDGGWYYGSSLQMFASLNCLLSEAAAKMLFRRSVPVPVADNLIAQLK